MGFGVDGIKLVLEYSLAGRGANFVFLDIIFTFGEGLRCRVFFEYFFEVVL